MVDVTLLTDAVIMAMSYDEATKTMTGIGQLTEGETKCLLIFLRRVRSKVRQRCFLNSAFPTSE